MSNYAVKDEPGVAFVHDGWLRTVNCPSCQIIYALPSSLYDWLKKHSEASQYRTMDTYCPNGHEWRFTGADAEERQRRRAENAEAELERAREQRDAAKRSAAAEKGHRTRILNRIKNGVCPWCNRTFQDVRRHARSKHEHQLAELEA